MGVPEEAVKYGVKTFYADRVERPGYMKTSGKDTNGGSICGVPGATCSSGDWRQAYANYLLAYVKFHADAGVKITHLGFLNEPEFSASYASMSSNGAPGGRLHQGPLPHHPGREPPDQLGIACCDSEGWGNQVSMVNAIKSAGAETMLKAITSHTYTGGPSGQMNTKVPVWLSEQS